MAQLVEAHRAEAGGRGGALERATLDVATPERCAVAGDEDEVAGLREARGLPLIAQQREKLVNQRMSRIYGRARLSFDCGKPRIGAACEPHDANGFG